MRVQTFNYGADMANETPNGPPCDFNEAFPLDSCDYVERVTMYAELKRTGRAWVGGGATPLFLVMRVN